MLLDVGILALPLDGTGGAEAEGGVGAASGAGEEVEAAAALTDVASTLGAEEAGGRGPLDCSGFGAEDGGSCPPMVGWGSVAAG